MNKFNRFKKVLQKSVDEMIRRDVMPDSQYDKLINVHPKWEHGTAYTTNDRLVYENELYEVVQGHTSQSGWEPNAVPALFKKIVPDNVIGEWQMPTGAHDTYQKGDRVIYDNKVWVSTADNNVWQPGVFGWDEA